MIRDYLRDEKKPPLQKVELPPRSHCRRPSSEWSFFAQKQNDPRKEQMKAFILLLIAQKQRTNKGAVIAPDLFEDILVSIPCTQSAISRMASLLKQLRFDRAVSPLRFVDQADQPSVVNRAQREEDGRTSP
ncbi:MAG TPA: hypothetical protein DEB40_07375 [Elusimicrobia bacterium]|nr:hypothetical protein [Elusimicrobiota bacterium]HBT61548.1 hypothetical protein [Elusimicrobiota bacterium]